MLNAQPARRDREAAAITAAKRVRGNLPAAKDREIVAADDNSAAIADGIHADIGGNTGGRVGVLLVDAQPRGEDFDVAAIATPKRIREDHPTVEKREVLA